MEKMKQPIKRAAALLLCVLAISAALWQFD
ncbi:MAG: hypothetical protein RIR86_2190, partial [Acidobacteriota bacterium]